jgi:AraC family transcriptional regulator
VGACLPLSTGSLRATSLDARRFRVVDHSFGPLRLRTHEHERACFGVVLEGGIEKSDGKRTLAVEAGCAFGMPAQARHADRFATVGTRIVSIECGDELVEELGPCSPLVARIDRHEAAGLSARAWRIATELAAPDSVAPLAVEGLALELLAAAARQAFPPPRRPRWLTELAEQIHSRFAEPLRIDELAEAAGVHPVHLARTFRAHYGVSVGGYVRALRIEAAASRLAKTDDPLARIAAHAGFADQSHLTRVFRRHMGTTPGRYRASLRR